MSKKQRIQWIITPKSLPSVRRNCSKCGGKTVFVNSGKFRVNGNGRLLDVWLIYRCNTCKTTWNLAIYERISPDAMDRREYEGFLNNDRKLVETYGNSRELFARNAAEMIESQEGYEVRITETTIPCQEEESQEIEIRLAGALRLRADVLFADQLGVTRSQVKKLFDQGLITSEGQKVAAGSRVRDGQLFRMQITAT